MPVAELGPKQSVGSGKNKALIFQNPHIREVNPAEAERLESLGGTNDQLSTRA